METRGNITPVTFEDNRFERSLRDGGRAAGTYGGEVVVAGGLVFAVLNPLSADGTFVTEPAVGFGSKDGAPLAFRGGRRGNWRRGASSESAMVYFPFSYDD